MVHGYSCYHSFYVYAQFLFSVKAKKKKIGLIINTSGRKYIQGGSALWLRFIVEKKKRIEIWRKGENHSVLLFLLRVRSHCHSSSNYLSDA